MFGLVDSDAFCCRFGMLDLLQEQPLITLEFMWKGTFMVLNTMSCKRLKRCRMQKRSTDEERPQLILDCESPYRILC